MTTLTQRIAIRLKALRKDRGWSLDKTAAQTGVSKAMLGQIEREESSPTIATLWKIATGFTTSFSSFIADEPEQEIHFSDDKMRVHTLFAFDKELGFELFVIELVPGSEHLSSPHAQGVVEHLIVIEGEMDVFVDNQWKKLRTGEGFRFAANQPHGYRNLSGKKAIIHDIIHYPKI